MKIALLLIYASTGFLLQIRPTPTEIKSLTQQDKVKLEAFDVLQAKCNVCHRTRNPGKLFTLQNMNEFASKINQQVFVKKRMPRGKKIKLSDTDRIKLQKWLSTINIKQQ